ncbi:sodium channel, voltage-gated, type I, beta a isoform X1 [Gadus macrocephalus]|uniref:sodium channel, voltage-gated, type I, beta a isoform X1 n=1 Tax=Gadus macrocephalus TaxID=80720 RepID=UPI0028CB8449|nr:sodium channel, voltage-gated, type I, beta a isoform X1 [Gadus macrocephalus]
MWVLGLLLAVLLLMKGQESWGACVEVDSDTEAVATENFKLGCICCKRRAEVPATASVDWYYMKVPNTSFVQFHKRLTWKGSENSTDLQDGSILLHNVTTNDTGLYRCEITRNLTIDKFSRIPTYSQKNFTLTVVEKPTRPDASIISEVMMYVSIIGLQLWLLVEMIYCYGKISAAGVAQRESMAEYIATSPTEKNSEDLLVDE